jgi:5-methylcytosine-specific restriction protein A
MAPLRIADLPAPVTAVKAEWTSSSTWIGFTPRSDGPNAVAQCQSTINRQLSNGFVIEYITLKSEVPNPGHETDPEYLAAKEEHSRSAGLLVAVHRLRPTARDLRTIVGSADYERLQDTWARQGRRKRWSVAFPIVETYDIETRPPANTVFSAATVKRVLAHSSSTLRPLTNSERSEIADLALIPKPAANAWVAIEDQIEIAEASDLPENILRDICDDLGDTAREGMSDHQWAKVRRRAAWLAKRFADERRKANNLTCDHCSFDPAERLRGTSIRPRSTLDVHHKNPLQEGRRLTTLADFALLCPTCHRIEHLLLNAGNASS